MAKSNPKRVGDKPGQIIPYEARSEVERRFFHPDGSLKQVGGRPSLLTAETAQEIVRNVLRCGKIILSVQAAGILADTYRHWVVAAKEGREPYATFYRAVWAARGEYMMNRVARIEAAEEWQSSAWILERIGTGDEEPGMEFVKPLQAKVEHTHRMEPPRAVDSQEVIDAEALVLKETIK